MVLVYDNRMPPSKRFPCQVHATVTREQADLARNLAEQRHMSVAEAVRRALFEGWCVKHGVCEKCAYEKLDKINYCLAPTNGQTFCVKLVTAAGEKCAEHAKP
jgi:hypothetical protein